eukprot:5006790-Prymnesium_polylepis.1
MKRALTWRGGGGAPRGQHLGDSLTTGSVLGGGAWSGSARSMSAATSSGTARRREQKRSSLLRASSSARSTASPLSSQCSGRASTADLHA